MGSDETTYDHWMNGAIKNNYTREVAQKIWDDVLEFASYAFNKSHSAGYAILLYADGMAQGALSGTSTWRPFLTSYTGKTDKIVHYVSACRHDGIPVLSQMSTSPVPSSRLQGGRALWSGRHPRRGHRRGAGDYRRARGGRSV